MKVPFSTVILASSTLLLSTVEAKNYILTSCQSVAATYEYGCEAVAGPHGSTSASTKCLCSNEPFMQTVISCAIMYDEKSGDPQEIDFSDMDSYCHQAVDVSPYLDYDHSSLKPFKGTSSNSGSNKESKSKEGGSKEGSESGSSKTKAIVSEPILLDKQQVLSQANANKTSDRMVFLDFVFACAPIVYFFGILVIKSFFHFMQKATPSLYQKMLRLPVVRPVRKHFTLPPTVKIHHSQPAKWGSFPFSIPQRIETLIIAGFVILSIIFSFAGIWIYYPNPKFKTDRGQWGKYIGRRSSYLTLGAYDLVLLFAGRNNFWMWFTGWPLDTFNAFHKWAARMTLFHLLVHAIGYGIADHARGVYRWHEAYMQWGIVGILFFGFLIVHSIKYLRQKGYELFLVIHILFAVFAMVASWIHVRNDGIEFLYAGVAMWGFDHACRIGRIVVSGINAKAHVQLVSPDVMRMEIDYSRVWKTYPGAHVFVHFVNSPLTAWQSHPFTVVPHKRTVDGKDTIVLYTRVRNGMTKRLARQLETLSDKSKQFNVLIDGPYGSCAPLHQYNTVVLIAGGIGITTILAHGLDLAQNKAKTERIVLVWAVSTEEQVDNVSQELATISSDARVEVQLYITKDASPSAASSTPNSDSESSIEKSKEAVSVTTQNTTRSYHRPDIAMIIAQEIHDARGSMAVKVCGPGTLNDDVRRAVTNNVDSAPVCVDYFEESFSW